MTPLRRREKQYVFYIRKHRHRRQQKMPQILGLGALYEDTILTIPVNLCPDWKQRATDKRVRVGGNVINTFQVLSESPPLTSSSPLQLKFIGSVGTYESCKCALSLYMQRAAAKFFCSGISTLVLNRAASFLISYTVLRMVQLQRILSALKRMARGLSSHTPITYLTRLLPNYSAPFARHPTSGLNGSTSRAEIVSPFLNS
jgi:hypothetical protein